MYKVIKPFVDLQDDMYPYGAGDKFPRKGKRVSKSRLLELSGSDNKQGTPLIEEVPNPEKQKGKEEKKPEE